MPKHKPTKLIPSTSAIKLDDPSLASIPDPTDFPEDSDSPGLRKLDSAFACSICGEVFNAPVGLPCGHAFCSLCVRQFLKEMHECPQCRHPAEEGKLVKSVQLEEMADCWRVARGTILEIIHSKKRLEEELRERARAETPRKRRKVVSSRGQTSSGTGSVGPPDSDGISRLTEAMEVVDDFSEEEEIIEVSKPESEPNTAQCPACDKPILFKHINAHLDSGCKRFLELNVGKEASKRANAKNAWSNVFGGGSASSSSKGKEVIIGNDRIPKPSYTVLKEKKIREMLNEYDLPTSGTKDQLVARHSQFVTMYNANLDSSEKNRKSLAELRKELSEWERMRTVKKPSVGSAREHLGNNEADFRKHVALARASAKRTAAAKDSPNSSQTSKQSLPEASSSPRKSSVSEGRSGNVVMAAGGQQEL